MNHKSILTSAALLAAFALQSNAGERRFTYSYEATTVSDLNPIYYSPEILQRNPYLRDSLLIGEGGYRRASTYSVE